MCTFYGRREGLHRKTETHSSYKLAVIMGKVNKLTLELYMEQAKLSYDF